MIPTHPVRLLLLSTAQDEPFLPTLKALMRTKFPEVQLLNSSITPGTLTEIVASAKKNSFDGVLTTNLAILKKLVGVNISSSEASIANYAGSYFKVQGTEFVILNPLAQLVTVPYGKFLAERFISKLVYPKRWPEFPAFNWELATPQNLPALLAHYRNAKLIAVDIETAKEPQVHITSIGYTAVFHGNTCHSFVLPTKDSYSVEWMKRFNLLPADKILQNGKYDINYLMRYGAPLHNYLWDTANLFHCWYSELPKDLGFLQAFFVREAAYWKDLADTDKLLYNAKDTWATAMSCLAMINEMPVWAKHNYINEFPLVFPCILSELTGIKRDMRALATAESAQRQVIQETEQELNAMLGTKAFNSGSPKQKKALLTVLGCKDIADKSTDEKSLKKAAFRHPLNARILGQITKIQKAKKLNSTYLTPGKEFNGTILYSLNPHGTDTSRLASREHAFWCGINVQNITRGASLPKYSLVPYEGFHIAEVDLEQAESRDTAYAAGEERLIAAVSGDKDFHSLNAASFFGVSYADIFDVVQNKVKDKERRELGKKVNHGANYLMGANVLVETMGEENIYKAARLLNLPKFWGAKQIAEELLSRFHATYPGLSTVYYPAVVAEIIKTKVLASRATHKLTNMPEWIREAVAPYWNLEAQERIMGLTRYCFSDPSADKRAKNAYVAHVSQSLNAMTLNKAYMLVFYAIALDEELGKHFKLCAQIHDSILHQFRVGHEYLAHKVQECMEIPVDIRGYDGKIRSFTVPAAIKAGKANKGALSWAEI